MFGCAFVGFELIAELRAGVIGESPTRRLGEGCLSSSC